MFHSFVSRRAFILANIIAFLAVPRSVHAQGLNTQPMFVLPFQSSAKVPNSTLFRLVNLGQDGVALNGLAALGAKGVGVLGGAEGGVGVFGHNTTADNDGVRGSGLRGVRGISFKPAGAGVMGLFKPTDTTTVDAASLGTAQTFPVKGSTRGWLGTPLNGVMGRSDVPEGKGVAGFADADKNSVGVYGASIQGFAGFFQGKVTITEHLLVTQINAQSLYAEKGLIGGAAGKFFKIDHPLDPANKFLYHASVESHEYKNLYDGTVTLDDSGTATVVLPQWFEALNSDYRYQLTTIGGYAPVYIAREVQDGRFVIAGGRAGLKISWQVTGVRHDAYAKQHPVKVEEVKLPDERGKYISPVELGFPERLKINAQKTSVSRVDGKKQR